MATVTKLKAEIFNKNLPVLGEDGNLYSYYYGRYFNAITERGYTPTSTEKAALDAFIQNGIDNGWIDFIKYFLPIIGDSTHLSAATVPLIDNVGNYTMSEYSGSENFTNSFVITDNKIKYYGGTPSATPIKSPCRPSDMNGGICFSGYIPYPELTLSGSANAKNYCCLPSEVSDKYYFAIRRAESSTDVVNHKIGYSTDGGQTSLTYYDLNMPSSDTLKSLYNNEKSLVVNYGLYKENGVVKRLRNFLDENGGSNYVNGEPDTAFSYPDYSSVENKLYFGIGNGATPQKFGCIGVLDAPKVTSSLVSLYNSAVFTLMAALGK